MMSINSYNALRDKRLEWMVSAFENNQLNIVLRKDIMQVFCTETTKWLLTCNRLRYDNG